jgi:hypothetical protein
MYSRARIFQSRHPNWDAPVAAPAGGCPGRTHVKERIVRQRGYENIRLNSEQVAEFDYQPTLCEKSYRVVAVAKNLSVERGDRVLFDDVRYFFYITNDRAMSAPEVVFCANDRCDQENLIEQLKNGVRALQASVDNLTSNWAYMVMASLAWTLKAWFSLSLPETGRWASKHKAEKESVLRMKFKTFLNAFVRVPCRIVRTGRRSSSMRRGDGSCLPRLRGRPLVTQAQENLAAAGVESVAARVLPCP